MLPVVKAHAYGNDFLYVTEAAVQTSGVAPERLAVAMCDRHRGVGADGLVVFSEAGLKAQMQVINSDGSRAEVSGNGVRGLGAVLARRGHLAAGETLTIVTGAGPKHLDLLTTDGTRFEFRADMGQPRSIESTTLVVAGEHLPVTCLDMGNPQCVLLGPLDQGRLETVGRALQSHPAFPNAVNFELVEVVSRRHLRILIWERGAGPTMSSGTGSCAAAVAAVTAGVANADLVVESPGGSQRVSWAGGHVTLVGWAEVVFEGQWLGSAN